MEFKILRVDAENKKIGLSARAMGKDEPIVDAKVYSSQAGSGMASLGELADFGLGKSEPETKPEPEPEAKSEPAPEVKVEPEPEGQSEPEATSEPEPEPVSEPNTAPELVSEPAAEGATEPNTAPEAGDEAKPNEEPE
jgi:hypothetical protein